MDTNQAGEQPVEKAQEELKPTSEAPTEEMSNLTKAQAEELAKAAEEATKIAEKLASDNSNIKKWNFKLKKQLEENGLEEEEEKPTPLTEERVAQIVAEAVKSVVPKTEEDELAKSKRMIEEMRLVMANKASMATSAGTNMDKAEVKSPTGFTPEQEAEIKAKYPNLRIEDVIKNMPQNKGSEGMSS